MRSEVSGCLLCGCDVLSPLLAELPVVTVRPHNPPLWAALWGECDGQFCLLVYTTCDSVDFPMPMLVVFTAVICGEAHYASELGGFSAECDVKGGEWQIGSGDKGEPPFI